MTDSEPAVEPDVELVLIAAVAANGVIGDDNDIPWYHPEDLKHFKRTTRGHPVVMGRKTYESIANRLGGPLPDRHSIVLTRTGLDPTPDEAAVSVVTSLDDAIERADTVADETAFVIGGATVYEQFLPYATRMILTELAESYPGDTLFPDWDSEDWIEQRRDEHEELAFVEYVRQS